MSGQAEHRKGYHHESIIAAVDAAAGHRCPDGGAVPCPIIALTPVDGVDRRPHPTH